MASELIKEIKVKVMEVINNKIIVVFKGLRVAFENKNSKYRKGDIVTLQYTKTNVSLK